MLQQPINNIITSYKQIVYQVAETRLKEIIFFSFIRFLDKIAKVTEFDQKIHRFSIYQIKKHTFKPYDYRWTTFYEDPLDFFNQHPMIRINNAADELVICSTIIDADNYSILTTRLLITKENGIEAIALMAGAKRHDYPIQFKLEKYNYVIGTVTLSNGNTFRHFIEAGKAAMIMIYGLRTFIGDRNIPLLNRV